MLGVLRQLGHHYYSWAGEYHTRSIGGAKVGYYRLGGGAKSVVLLHGLGDSALSWRHVAIALSRHVEVILPELPGFGLSTLPPGRDHLTPNEYRRLLHEFFAPFADRKPLLVGNSMGAWYAAHLLIDAPERFSGTVMINPGGVLVPEAEFSGETFFGFLNAASGAAIAARLFHRPPLYSPLIAKGLEAQMRSPVVQRFGMQIRFEDLLSPEQLRLLPAHAVLVWGERDNFLPLGTRDVFFNHFPGRVVPLPHVAHMAHVEDPKRTVSIILETLGLKTVSL